MAWSSLGTKEPTFEFQLFDTDLLGDELIRISQTYNPQEVTRINKIQLWEYYPTDGYRYLRTIYPSTTPRLYSLVVPPPFVEAGKTLRSLAVRHGWAGVVAEANWTITIEVWTP